MLEVPRLMTRIQGKLKFADADMFMELHNWSLLDHPARLGEHEFNIHATAHSFEIDVDRNGVIYRITRARDQLELYTDVEGWTPESAGALAGPPSQRDRPSSKRTAQMASEFDRPSDPYAQFIHFGTDAMQISARPEDQPQDRRDPTAGSGNAFISAICWHPEPNRRFPLITTIRSETAYIGTYGATVGTGSRVSTSWDRTQFPPSTGLLTVRRSYALRLSTACLTCCSGCVTWRGILLRFHFPRQPAGFYPDLLAKLKDGRLLVVEYKGAHIAKSSDTLEKRTIGELWCRQSGGKCPFLVVEKDVDGKDVRQQLIDCIRQVGKPNRTGKGTKRNPTFEGRQENE